jgi:hypothetical protein
VRPREARGFLIETVKGARVDANCTRSHSAKRWPAGLAERAFGEMNVETIGWLETIEFVDFSGTVVRQARYFAYPKSPPTFPSRLRSQCFEFVGRAIRMNGELPEGIFVREKSSQFSRVTTIGQLDRLTAYYETTEWRCVRV